MSNYLTVPEMAGKVKIATVTAYKWVQSGKVKSETILGKKAIRADHITDIAKLVSENTRITALRSKGGAE
ncbi:hypothetical protein GOX01_23960 [Gluconobacter oxydans]|uniref:Helix-turn-helix domain-containing protein n=1 Tax=Gluconobacter oxydans TaxID=442 RepID=A0AB35ARF8_GLUOY|nr:hypothetical protein [Gluconobacter oxydans]MBF0857496.1 hypothetical protein [Gluconobacter oxydans]GEC62065.1 hypothetical protein GOX01_23960 [Gluconobacter oxydans]